MQLPHPYPLKAATVDNQWRIRWLVLSAGLDPTQIWWSQFWVITTGAQVIGCGQLRQFADAQVLRRKLQLTHRLARVLPVPLVVMQYGGDRPT